MRGNGTVRRGLRFGMRVGTFHAVGFAIPCGLAGLAALVSRAPVDWLFGLQRATAAIGGSLAVGALLGLATGGLLVVLPRWITARGLLRGLLTAVLGGAVYTGETVVVAVATDVGYLPVLLSCLGWPIVAAVTAAHSGDIAGLSHYHPWLWESRGRTPTGVCAQPPK
ncbi:hypothetical protein [Streptomyces inhibens]|uniref:hypothetical protein n=1 Tax=Streptomyces inhibens TaxID=2293571 RepID=UPI001EE6BC6B|nr:hypothetical protein [Streptomyces inhibens]UKY52668.1 hypothetical protein KI385_30295 [Streptomyces inhibens]